MSTYTDKFFADKAVGALWDVAVSIKRGNPLPLDKDSVVHGLTELNAIATGSVSYPGQIIAVVEDAVYEGEGEDKVLVTEESVTLYYLDHNKTPREVGKVPTGDGKTIEVSSEGAISLLGSAGAADGTLPMLEDGALVWKTLEDIGAGDGNDNTTYEFTKLTKGEGDAAECYGFKIQVKENGVATGDPIEIALDVYTKSEADARFQPIGNYKTTQEAKEFTGSTIQTVTGVTQDTNGVVSVTFENVAFPEDKNTTYTLGYESKVEGEDGHPARIVLTPSEGEATYVDATPFIKDGMLDNVEYDADTNTLTFTFNTEAGKEAVEVELTDILAPYTGTDGERVKVTVTGTEIAADLKTGTITKDYLDAGVQTSLGLADTALQEHQDISHLAVKTEVETAIGTAKSEAIADAASKYATKEYVGNIPEGYTESNVIAYVNKKAQEVLDSATGGSSESAASVKQQLDTYKAANDPKVKALLEEVWGSETYTGDSRIDTLETGVASAIKDVKAATNAKITVSVDTDKIATIDDAALQTLIAEAKKAGTDANSALETYKGTNDAAVDKVRTDLAAEAGKLAILTETVNGHTTSITEHGTKLGALEGTVAGHTASITTLSGDVAKKAEQSALNDAVARIATNEDAIKALNDTTIPGINNKFNDYYTKTEVGTIEEGKTLVEMIAAAGDKSAIEGRVKAIEDDYLKAADKNELAGLINGHETRIAEMEKFWEAADDPAGTIDKLAEIVDYIAKDESGALDMAADIEANSDAIAALTKTVGDNKTATDEAIAAITDNYKVKDVDNTSLALDENGVASIKKVSTDLLENGSQELIFKAGNASGYNTEATE